MTMLADTPIVMLKKRDGFAMGHIFGVKVQRAQRVADCPIGR